MTVAIVECGIGNVQSVANACRQIAPDTVVVADGAALTAANPQRVILPGVGAIGTVLANLRGREIAPVLERLVRGSGVPFLGICVGMQVLADVCEEFGSHRGFGWIPGHVRRMAPVVSRVRLPHVGWNTIAATWPDDPLMRDIDGKDAYFVHSYAMDCPREFVLATTEYEGVTFPCAVRRDNIAGVQFHPEKSSLIGAALLTAFIGDGLCTNAA